MKREELSHNYYDTIEELQRDVDEYVEFFNNIRPHQRLGMQTPSEVERDFANKKEKSILDFPTKSVQNTLTVSLFSPPQNGEFFKSQMGSKFIFSKNSPRDPLKSLQCTAPP